VSSIPSSTIEVNTYVQSLVVKAEVVQINVCSGTISTTAYSLEEWRIPEDIIAMLDQVTGIVAWRS
jgi:hypothetical protein